MKKNIRELSREKIQSDPEVYARSVACQQAILGILKMMGPGQERISAMSLCTSVLLSEEGFDPEGVSGFFRLTATGFAVMPNGFEDLERVHGEMLKDISTAGADTKDEEPDLSKN